MTSTNRSTRPPGFISIPVEFVSESRSTTSSSNSSTWKGNRPYQSIGRFQPRQSPASAYERLIRNSQFNQPLRDSFPSRTNHQRVFESTPSYFSRSKDDLLDSKMDTHRSDPPPPKVKEHFRRSYDALNDYLNTEQDISFNPPKPNSRSSYDLSNDQYENQADHSSTRPPPGPSTEEQTKRSTDLSNSSAQSDQQVPSNDHSSIERDPNVVALEKLEEIQRTLTDFSEQVDAYTGSTRNDRLYKGLDEQAVKIMMRCDELVNVNADIKEKRKEMIRNVQSVLAKLESKVPLTPSVEENSNPMESTVFVFDSTTETAQTKSTASEEQEPRPKNTLEEQ